MTTEDHTVIHDLTPALLEAHRITSLPPSIYYLPRFLTPNEQSQILTSLPSTKWTHLSHRRLQAHPSALSAAGTLLAAPLPPYLTHPVLARFTQLGVFDGSPHCATGPNHCLVNEYAPGQGIMPHEDGARYWPCTATVSLGGTVVLDVVAKPDASSDVVGGEVDEREVEDGPGPLRRWRIVQEPGSLLVTRGEVYATTLHGIPEVEVDEQLGPDTVANWELLGDRGAIERARGRNVRAVRTSLTYRDVVKVSQAGNRILGFGRR